jgi:hypothetical protein
VNEFLTTALGRKQLHHTSADLLQGKWPLVTNGRVAGWAQFGLEAERNRRREPKLKAMFKRFKIKGIQI